MSNRKAMKSNDDKQFGVIPKSEDLSNLTDFEMGLVLSSIGLRMSTKDTIAVAKKLKTIDKHVKNSISTKTPLYVIKYMFLLHRNNKLPDWCMVKVDEYCSKVPLKAHVEVETNSNLISTKDTPIQIALAQSEEWLDIHLSEFEATGKLPKWLPYLKSMVYTRRQQEAIAAYYKPQLVQIKLAVDGDDKELTEAFGGSRQARKIMKILEQLVNHTEKHLEDTLPIKSPRKKHIKTPEQLTKHLFCLDEQSYDKFKLRSKPVADIINSTEVWIYRVDSRRLHRVQSETGVGVKGQELVNTKKITWSTLRNPKEFLMKFTKASVKSKRTLFQELGKAEPATQDRVRMHRQMIVLETQ